MRFKEYLDKNYINESSLSRIQKHMIEHDTGMITAFRYAENCGFGKIYTKKENKARNKSLLSKLQRQGYGITKVKGSYIENYNSNNEIEVGEEVYFVVDLNNEGNLKQKLKELGLEFEQDSILFIPKNAEYGLLIGTNKCEDSYPGYNVEKKLNNPIFGQSGEFFTRINGRPFILKEEFKIVLPPQNIMGKQALKIISNQKWEELINEI